MLLDAVTVWLMPHPDGPQPSLVPAHLSFPRSSARLSTWAFALLHPPLSPFLAPSPCTQFYHGGGCSGCATQVAAGSRPGRSPCGTHPSPPPLLPFPRPLGMPGHAYNWIMVVGEAAARLKSRPAVITHWREWLSGARAGMAFRPTMMVINHQSLSEKA